MCAFLLYFCSTPLDTKTPVHQQHPHNSLYHLAEAFCRFVMSGSQSDTEMTITRTHLDADQRASLLVEYNELLASGSYGKIAELAARYGVKRNYPAALKRLFEQRKQDGQPMTFRRTRGSGRPTIWTEDMVARFLDFAETEMYEFTIELASTSLGISEGCIHSYMKHNGWRTVQKVLRPSLTAKQMDARIEWAMKHRRSTWQGCIDIDEKWFFAVDTNGHLKCPPGVAPPRRRVQSKSHIQKVMALVAVARPSPQHGFNGVVGVWRVGKLKTAQRQSKNHKKSDTYIVDASMDSDLFLDMMTSKVIPAARRALHWCQDIVIQLDNAPAHASTQTLTSITRSLSATNRKYSQQVRLEFQPGQSPDTNILDLAVFPSLHKRLGSTQKRARPKDLEQLWQNVAKQVTEFPSDVLERAWQLKGQVLSEIIKHKGDNDFPIPHRK